MKIEIWFQPIRVARIDESAGGSWISIWRRCTVTGFRPKLSWRPTRGRRSYRNWRPTPFWRSGFRVSTPCLPCARPPAPTWPKWPAPSASTLASDPNFSRYASPVKLEKNVSHFHFRVTFLYLEMSRKYEFWRESEGDDRLFINMVENFQSEGT